jgi:hypothetical protein
MQISFVLNHDQLLHGGDRINYISMFNEATYSLALQAGPAPAHIGLLVDPKGAYDF